MSSRLRMPKIMCLQARLPFLARACKTVHRQHRFHRRR